MSFREMIRRKGYSAFSLLHVVVSVNFIPCWAEAIGCVAIVKKVGAEINRFGFYFNKMIFAGIGSPAQTLVIARQTGKGFVAFGSSFQNSVIYLHMHVHSPPRNQLGLLCMRDSYYSDRYRH
jgi:hypothetical protein